MRKIVWFWLGVASCELYLLYQGVTDTLVKVSFLLALFNVVASALLPIAEKKKQEQENGKDNEN